MGVPAGRLLRTEMKKMMMLAVAAVLMLSLAACSGKSSNSKEPSNLDEAVAMYQELMEQENQIFAKNKKLWAVSHPTNRKKRRTT